MWYSVDDDERFECKDQNLWSNCIDRSYAEECAEDFEHEHDGWESSWPHNFTLYETEDGPAVATFCVDRDYKAVFYAKRVTDSNMRKQDDTPKV